ncbi:MAG TPA: DedA family protein [Bacteroidota bacterium]|nr:DedA family protein [Bacteroidota bacterium]
MVPRAAPWALLVAVPWIARGAGSDPQSIADALVSIGWSPLLFVWAWTQGEPAVIVGGALAARGYWPWYAFGLLAASGSAIGHQIYYVLGRRYGLRLLAKLPGRWQPAIAQAQALVLRHENKILPLMRFAYGIRGPLPVVCGACGIPSGKFLLYNLLTALAWALLFTALGYAFGFAVTAFFDTFSHYESLLLVSSLAFGLCLQIIAQRWVKRSLEKG